MHRSQMRKVALPIVVATASVVVVLSIAYAVLQLGSDGRDDSGSPSSRERDATPTTECSTDQARSLKLKVEPLIEGFDDTNERAASTARIALSPAIGEMQEIRRELRAFDVPECAQEAKTLLVDYMDTTIDAYIAFLGGGSDSVGDFLASSLLEEAATAQLKAALEWAVIFAKAEE